ncbi:MAG: class I SAM-dependent methyltransferase, partial [Thermoplasmata archaeon]
MSEESDLQRIYTPGSESVYGEDIINMIAYMNGFTGLEHFLNIGYADSILEYFLFPLGISSKRLPKRLSLPLVGKAAGLDNILVVGCGRGGEAVVLHQETGLKIIGLDITPFNVKSSGEYALGLGLKESVAFILGDACCLPLGDKSVSCVFSCESAFHFEDKDRFIRESFRVLKDGGYLLIADIVSALPHVEPSAENEEALGEFARMLAAPEFFTLEKYRKAIVSAGFRRIIDEEVITRHNLRFLARGSTYLISLMNYIRKLHWLDAAVKRSMKKRNIDLDKFLEHSR